MKSFCLFALIACCAACSSQDVRRSPSTDTIFLERHVADTPFPFYHAIYIEKDHRHPLYDSTAPFAYSRFDDTTWSWMRTDGISRKHHDLAGLPAQTIPLHGYKNKLYAYYPEWDRTSITDSAMILRYFEPIAYAIKDISKTGNDRWSLTYVNMLFANESVRTRIDTVHIYMIDTARQLMVWEFLDKNNPHYELRIPRSRIREYDLVVNYCKTQETDLFPFDSLPLRSWIHK